MNDNVKVAFIDGADYVVIPDDEINFVRISDAITHVAISAAGNEIKHL